MHHIDWAPGITLDNIERQVIEKAYDFYKKNKTVTAKALGMGVRTLHDKLERYAKEDEVFFAIRDQRRKDKEDYLLRSRGLKPPEEPKSPEGAVDTAKDMPIPKKRAGLKEAMQ